MVPEVSLQQIFKSSNEKRDIFLSRVFGTWNEEIVRIWSDPEKRPVAPKYVNKGRPTLYERSAHEKGDRKHRSTLDFTFEENGQIYVVEMKCWLAYEKYKYLPLKDFSDLDFLRKHEPFKRFLDIPKNADKYVVRVNDGKVSKEAQVSGSILIWGFVSAETALRIAEEVGLHAVLSLQDIINELVEEENDAYFRLLRDKEEWCARLWNGLRGESV